MSGQLTEQFSSKSGSLFPAAEKLGWADKAGWIGELARWYEADWQLALKGGVPPAANVLLEILSETQRNEASKVLSSIDSYYRGEELEATENPGAEATIEFSKLNQQPELTQRQEVGHVVQPGDLTMPHLVDPTAREKTFFYKAAPVTSLDFSVGEKPGTASNSAQRTPNRSKLPAIAGYDVKEILGRGGMGIVYLATQQGIVRDVALKMVLAGAHADRETVERFQAEARAVGKFQHEIIVRIYDIGIHEGMPYFSLEYVDGKSLSEKIDNKPLDPLEAAKILVPLARGLQFAHEAGVIHRDLKPGNILLTSAGVPKLSDFGLAKQLETGSNLSRTGDVVGTPSYMAPEQALGERTVGRPADIYALGAVLYCTLTGRPPFLAAKPTDTLIQLLHKEPIAPTKLQPGLPTDLETICLKCLQKEPEKRYASAADFADDLQRFIDGEPIAARPVGNLERVVRWSRRKPLQAALIATAVSLAAVLAIGGPLAAGAIYTQKQEAESARRKADQSALVAIAAQQQAQLAKEEAEQNAEAALIQQKNAVDALKSLVFEVQRKMADDPQLLALRSSLLKVASNGLDRIEQSGGDAITQNIIAAGIDRRLGDVNLELGRMQQARDRYAKCLAALQVLDEQQKLPGRRHNLSTIQELLGRVQHSLGELKLAKEHYLTSLDHRRQWVSEEPDNADVKQNLAAVLGRLGGLAKDEGDLNEALTWLTESNQLRQQQLDSEPSNAGAEMETIGSRWSLASLNFQRLQLESSMADMQSIVDRLTKKIEVNPQDIPLQQNTVLATVELGMMLMYVDRSEEASTLVGKAIERMQSIEQNVGESLRYKQRLADAYYLLGMTSLLSKQTEKATTAWEECFRLRRELYEVESDNLAYVIALAQVAARLDRIEPYLDALMKIDFDKASVGVKFVLACTYAQAAESMKRKPPTSDKWNSDHLRQKALASMQAALAAGFHRPADLRYDPELAPIRSELSIAEL